MRLFVSIFLLLVGWGAGIATGLFVPQGRIASLLSAHSEKQVAPPDNFQIATSAVRSVLSDPFSSYFEELRISTQKDGHGPYVCGLVNSKNAMGGYVGLKHFIFARADNTVVFEKPDDYKSYREFTEDWNKICEPPNLTTKAAVPSK